MTTARADEPLWTEDVDAASPVMMCSDAGSALVPGDLLVVGPPVLPPLPSNSAVLGPLVAPSIDRAALVAAHPRLADRFELADVEAVLARWDGNPLETRDAAQCALERALASPSSAVAAHARVVRARCLLMVDDPDATENLESLLRRYPELPDEVALRLEEARSLARRDRRIKPTSKAPNK
ncbi:MAG: hypothetical protein J0L92_37870, partial [Deltaproteobacteria bacterium]|nr:hypothetical protein [Deltaproteobacteria bacterium]